ncbi:MAG TPA: hypothetical protein VFG29_14610 [Syntrophales bacterium]|nr:hypothetical protein [Syntrophales bacterium]
MNGRTFDQNGGIVDGNFISSPTAQIAIEKRFYLCKKLFAGIEGKYTPSWVHVPIAGASADA